jgi:hypothetical protein
MKQRINEFIDLFPDFDAFDDGDQILYMIYFQAVEEGRASASQPEIESLFRLASLPVPKNLGQKLGYLCGRGGKLLRPNKGEYELHRDSKRTIEEKVRDVRGQPARIAVNDNGPFDFKGRTFTDEKIAVLLDELRRCHAMQCWNACGLLMRIVIERTVDTVDPAVKAKTGLKDKLNRCRDVATLGKSVRESIEHLHGAKIIGDIAAHDSKVVIDEPDITLVLPHFRVLLKSVTTV